MTRANVTNVTIVIPAWNEGDFIGDTLLHIVEQSILARVIVVDDCSTDDTAEIARSFPGVEVVSLTKKAGSKSQALNAVLHVVKTEFFICVDADTLLAPDAVENLLKAFEKPKVTIACGHVSTVGRKGLWQGARNADYVVGQRIWKSAQQKIGAILVMSGCLFAIRTEYLKRYGFDARTMAEDMDLTWRAIADGHEVAYVPNARCYVHDPDTWKLYSNQVMRWFRGYFQCMKVRKWKLPLKFGAVVYFYMLMNIFSVPMSAWAMVWVASDPRKLAAFFVWMLFIYAYCMFLERKNPIGLAIDMLRYMVVAYMNWGLYMYSLWKEIVARDKLTVWVKGH